MLVETSLWIIGGDGWAYDIGYGGLDHVLASGRNVNILVLDTEVYSNTGGQMSKATPRGAVAKFAAGGKPTRKKDLGLIAMSYGNVYVAQVAMGARDEHTLRAFIEAEAYDGPSLIIAYSHCIAHGIDMGTAMQNQKAAVDAGQWPLYRYNPMRAEAGENPFSLDSRKPKIPVEKYMYMENRFKMLTKSKPEVARELLEEAQRRRRYPLGALRIPGGKAGRAQQWQWARRRCGRGEVTMDLTTTYLGKTLRSPLVASASPLSERLFNIKRMEDVGAAAVVLYSLFEEQITHEQFELHHHMTYGTESFPEALTYFPEPDDFPCRAGRLSQAHP